MKSRSQRVQGDGLIKHCHPQNSQKFKLLSSVIGQSIVNLIQPKLSFINRNYRAIFSARFETFCELPQELQWATRDPQFASLILLIYGLFVCAVLLHSIL